MNVGKAIKEIRIERGLKQYELADKAGISTPYLSEIENHRKKNPDLETIEKICNALEVSVQILFFKALNETEIKDPSKKRLIRDIKPLFDSIISELYSLDNTNSLGGLRENTYERHGVITDDKLQRLRGRGRKNVTKNLKSKRKKGPKKDKKVTS